MKSRYKNIGVEYFEDRKSIVLTFQERNFTDAKWLSAEEAKDLIKKIEDVLKEVK